jgi:hypothetical protein
MYRTHIVLSMEVNLIATISARAQRSTLRGVVGPLELKMW